MLPVRVELWAEAEGEQELVLELFDLDGHLAHWSKTQLCLPAGQCWIESLIPPDVVPTGRYQLRASIVGHDCHCCRRPLQVFAAPCPTPQQVGEKLAGCQALPGPMPRSKGWVMLEQVRLCLEGGDEPPVLPFQASVRFEIRLNLEGLSSPPCVRVQIFSAADEMLTGTNTTRWELDLPHQGRAEVTVEYERLNLTPGRYLFTVGLWPDEGPVAPIEARHAAHELVIGEPGAGDALLASLEPRYSWRRDVEPQGASAEALEVVNDPQPGPLAQGAELELELRLGDGAQACAWVETQQGGVVGLARALPYHGAAAALLSWRLKANLAEGDYTLCCANWPRAAQQPDGTIHRWPLQITAGDPPLRGLWSGLHDRGQT